MDAPYCEECGESHVVVRCNFVGFCAECAANTIDRQERENADIEETRDELLAALRETVARLQRTDKLLCEKTGHTAAYELGEVIRARAAIAKASE